MPESSDAPKLPINETERTIAIAGFHFIERILLIIVALMTLAAASIELVNIYRTMTVTLADILMMFLYTEVVGMVTVFYTGRGLTFVYPILIAITALARLIILQGKEMAAENIVFEASAILLLSIAVAIIIRGSKHRTTSELG